VLLELAFRTLKALDPGGLGVLNTWAEATMIDIVGLL